MSPEITEFAKLLIAHVRDMAISELDISLRPSANDPRTRRWRQDIKGEKMNKIQFEMIPDCVDCTLFHFLNAIDQGLLKISFTSKTGAVIDLTKHGESEMAGEFMGADGWRLEYSEERVNNDFEDLV
jgi:hypothetical protein